jgi:hypothetical protein
VLLHAMISLRQSKLGDVQDGLWRTYNVLREFFSHEEGMEGREREHD